MPQIINTNIASLNAQRNLNSSQSSLNVSLQRLSSGLRINSARDDAAGLAIAERFTAQIRGLNQAARNANDGVSLAQVAEGALGQTTSNLQRIRELAIQSANSTNSATDRAALQTEVAQLISEVDRIATTTQFNGLNLLDGTFTTQQFQVGANANQTISVSVSGARTTQLGSVVNQTSNASQTATQTVVSAGTNLANTQANTTYTGVTGTASNGSNFTINGTSIGSSASYDTGSNGFNTGSAYSLAQAINASSVSGVSAIANNVQTFADETSDASFTDFSTIAASDSVNYTLSLNGTAVYSLTGISSGTADVSIDSIVSAINSFQGTTGVVASRDSNSDLVLTASDGRDITVRESVTFTDSTANATASTFKTSFNDYAETEVGSGTRTVDQIYRGSLNIQSSSAVSFNAAAATAFGFSAQVLNVDTTSNLSTVDISTVTGANAAILAVDAALDTINSSRATLGAVQNRFESTIGNLTTSSENLSAARSRIQDADFASETANLTKTQILQQAGISILSQANSLPQNVLALLQ